MRVLIIVTVPTEALDPLLEAVAAAGGGVIGHYTHCSFASAGVGRFRPDDAANPAYGERARINTVEETRVETFCERGKAKTVMQAIRAAHPYEEPVIYLLPLIDEEELG
jgi:hypothetical protein